MFGAGSDTTASAISVAVMASACYPEATERVRKELDSVIGKERRVHLQLFVFQPLINDGYQITAPQTNDRESLPQTMAFVLETFRWRPVTSGGKHFYVVLDHRSLMYLIHGRFCTQGNQRYHLGESKCLLYSRICWYWYSPFLKQNYRIPKGASVVGNVW